MPAEPAILSELEIRTKFPAPSMIFSSLLLQDFMNARAALERAAVRGAPRFAFYIDSFGDLSYVHSKNIAVHDMIVSSDFCPVCDIERERKLSVSSKKLMDLVEDLMPELLRPLPESSKTAVSVKPHGRTLRPTCVSSGSPGAQDWVAGMEIRGGRLRRSHFQDQNTRRSVLDDIEDKFGPKPNRKDWDAVGNLERNRRRYPVRRAA